MRTIVKALVIGSVAVFVLALAGPALAHHDHQLHNPGGCHTIPVGHQDHATSTGNMFHGAAHKGAATELVSGKYVLGQGNSVVWVDGNACTS